jgi:alpha-N-arabinofuranosidase
VRTALPTRITEETAGKHVPLVLTAYGHVQGNQPAGQPDLHLALIDGLVEANELLQYARIGIPLAHRFLLNDTPWNPNTDDGPTARRFNAAIVSDGTDSNFVATPAGLAMGLMSKLSGQTQVAADVSGNPTIPLSDGRSTPALSTFAAKDGEGNVDLVVINQSLDTDLAAQVGTPGLVHNPNATVTTLNGPSSLSINTLDHPDTVTNTTTHVTVGCGSFTYTFPAHSATLIRLSA